MKKFLFLSLTLLTLMACNQEQPANNKETQQEASKAKPATQTTTVNPIQKQSEIDLELIKQYLSKKGIDAQVTPSGLYYRIIKEGDKNKMPTASSNVRTNYKGMLLNGQVFDQSPEGKPISFSLDQVIPGWTEGIQLVGEGGTIQLIVPSRLAYGPRRISVIPPNSVLVFDVDLLEVN